MTRAAPPDFDPGPPPPSTLEVELSDAQLAAFARDGFVAVGRLTTDDELDWLRTVFDFLFEEKVGGFTGGYFDLGRPYDSDGEDLVPQVLHPSARVPRLRDTTLHRNARRVAEQLFGAASGELHTWDHMIRKPPLHGAELPWHQDEAYWDTGYRYAAVGCWVPLDDATPENGCLDFLPGSHEGAVLPHRHLGGDPAVHGLEIDPAHDLDVSDARTVPLRAGEATFHHCRTLHHSGPNRTSGPRRAYATEFQRPPERCDDDAPRPWVREGQQEWAASIERRTRSNPSPNSD